MRTTHTATRLQQPASIDSNWDKSPWRDIAPVHLKHYMGQRPEHRPEVQVKVAYDPQSIYVIFKVEDQYVRSTRTAYQDPVFKDSAVEFFFCPGDTHEKGYFNLEINCGGTALFRFRSAEGEKFPIPADLFQQMEIASSLPKVVDPEIQDPLTWTLEFKLPIAILKDYYDVSVPQAGAKWPVNFYKIADESSHPHYLTWSPVKNPTPNFHLPEYFGVLLFE